MLWQVKNPFKDMYEVLCFQCVVTPPPQNPPIPDPTPPPDHVSPVPHKTSPTTSTPKLVADFHGLTWYNSEDLIDLYEVP